MTLKISRSQVSTQPNPNHGWTQPMTNSATGLTFRDHSKLARLLEVSEGLRMGDFHGPNVSQLTVSTHSLRKCPSFPREKSLKSTYDDARTPEGPESGFGLVCSGEQGMLAWYDGSGDPGDDVIAAAVTSQAAVAGNPPPPSDSTSNEPRRRLPPPLLSDLRRVNALRNDLPICLNAVKYNLPSCCY